jgi:hypothetical protein
MAAGPGVGGGNRATVGQFQNAVTTLGVCRVTGMNNMRLFWAGRKCSFAGTADSEETRTTDGGKSLVIAAMSDCTTLAAAVC